MEQMAGPRALRKDIGIAIPTKLAGLVHRHLVSLRFGFIELQDGNKLAKIVKRKD